MDDDSLRRTDPESEYKTLADAYLRDKGALNQKLDELGLFDSEGIYNIVIGLSPTTFEASRERKALAIADLFLRSLPDLRYHIRVEPGKVSTVVIKKGPENTFSFGHRKVGEESTED